MKILENIRRISSKPFIGYPLACYLFATLLFFGTPKVSHASSTVLNQKSLFNAIFFGEGQLGQNIYSNIDELQLSNSVVKINAEEQRNITQLQDYYFSYISKTHPDFVKTFEANILSKDPQVIESTFKEGATNLTEAYVSLIQHPAKGSETDLSNYLKKKLGSALNMSPDVASGKIVYKYIAIYIAAAIAVAALLVLVFEASNISTSGVASISKNELKTEELVFSIVSNIAKYTPARG
jgi:SdpC family antimicrobial peptide